MKKASLMSDKQQIPPSKEEIQDKIHQTVSFSELNNQDRYRRFTISAKPSAANQAHSESAGNTRKQGEGQQKTEGSRAKSPLSHEAQKAQKEEAVVAAKDRESLNERISQVAASIIKNEELQEAQSDARRAGTPPVPIDISSGEGRKSVTRKSKKMVISSPIDPPVPFQEYLTKEDDGKFHILLACTGSVATIKVPLIIDKLFQIYGTSKVSIQLVVTKAAIHFLKGLKMHNEVKIWRDEDEWANYTDIFSVKTFTTTTSGKDVIAKKKNPFEKMMLHNELRKWADVMMIAPLSANTLAKIANGISDNLLTSIVRSWGPPSGNGVKKPIVVAPAMNTFMYTHPITAKQLSFLSLPDYGFNIEIIKPIEKVLVCGDIGMGGMCEWNELVEILRRKVNLLKKQKFEKQLNSSVGQVSNKPSRFEFGENSESNRLGVPSIETIGSRKGTSTARDAEISDDDEDEDEDGDEEGSASDNEDNSDEDSDSASSSDSDTTAKTTCRNIAENGQGPKVSDKEVKNNKTTHSIFPHPTADRQHEKENNSDELPGKGYSRDKQSSSDYADNESCTRKDLNEDSNDMIFDISDQEVAR